MIVADVGHALDIPGINKAKYGEASLGKGPILGLGSLNHPVVVQRLRQTFARDRVDAGIGRGGNDLMPFLAQAHRSLGTDQAGPADDHDFHLLSPLAVSRAARSPSP